MYEEYIEGAPFEEGYIGHDTCAERPQTHDHEFTGSVRLAEEGADRHNHRFAGVSSEAIPVGRTHIHCIKTRTDFLDHFHLICVRTGPAIIVNPGEPVLKHVHFVEGMTTVVDDHFHNFVFATLIEAPIAPLAIT